MIKWILRFGVLYFFVGLSSNGSDESLMYGIGSFGIDKNMDRVIYDVCVNLYYSIYFSCITFTTVGYGDLVVRNGFEIITMLEMILGVTYVGVLTGSIFKRYV